jgi:hypothetical protein
MSYDRQAIMENLHQQVEYLLSLYLILRISMAFSTDARGFVFLARRTSYAY